MESPIDGIIRNQGHLVLDGGLATTLEAGGHDLNHPLWSARMLMDDPEAIREVHARFLAAGADCITAATYQATFQGFAGSGLSSPAANDLFHRAVDLAVEARDAFWSRRDLHHDRLRPLVAASIGPYGAFLADGSEYTGEYGMDGAGLRAFHLDRWTVLSESRAEILACETIPSMEETRGLAGLIRDTPGRWAWVSFGCRDGSRIYDGTPLVEAVSELKGLASLAAVGINCTSPAFLPSLIAEARKATDRPILVYPNSGEIYDGRWKRWVPGDAPADWGRDPAAWAKAGVAGIGGCCRVGPDEIRTLRRTLLG